MILASYFPHIMMADITHTLSSQVHPMLHNFVCSPFILSLGLVYKKCFGRRIEPNSFMNIDIAENFVTLHKLTACLKMCWKIPTYS